MSEQTPSPEQASFLETADPGERLVLGNWALGERETELFSEASFADTLHETGKWDETAYWELDKALFDIAVKYQDRAMPRMLTRALVDLLLYINGRLAWHRMPSDLSTIEGFSDTDCHEWSERVEAAFRAAITGVPFENRYQDRINPLIG